MEYTSLLDLVPFVCASIADMLAYVTLLYLCTLIQPRYVTGPMCLVNTQTSSWRARVVWNGVGVVLKSLHTFGYACTPRAGEDGCGGDSFVRPLKYSSTFGYHGRAVITSKTSSRLSRLGPSRHPEVT